MACCPVGRSLRERWSWTPSLCCLMVTCPTLFPPVSLSSTTTSAFLAQACAVIMATARETDRQIFRFMSVPFEKRLSKFAGDERLVLLLAERDDREPSLPDQRRSSEQCTLFDVGQRGGFTDGLAGGDGHNRDLGIGGIDRDDLGGAGDPALATGGIDDELVSFAHLAQMFDRHGIGDPVPHRLLFLLKLLEGVDLRLGLEQVIHGK